MNLLPHKAFSKAFTVLSFWFLLSGPGHADHPTIHVDVLLTAQSDTSFWMHPRVGIVPHDQGHPIAVMTLQETDREGTHMYHGLSTMVWNSRDKKWSSPQRDSALARRSDAQGLIEVFVDATPSWHSITGKILLTGATF